MLSFAYLPYLKAYKEGLIKIDKLNNLTTHACNKNLQF